MDPEQPLTAGDHVMDKTEAKSVKRISLKLGVS